MGIAKKAVKLLTSALILSFVAGSFLYADSLSGKAKSTKDKILQDAKKQEQKNSGTTNANAQNTASSKEAKLEALRRKALDAMEFPEQMVAVYRTDRDGKKTLDYVMPVDGFCINKVGLTVEDIKLLFEWATSPERGENVYRFYGWQNPRSNDNKDEYERGAFGSFCKDNLRVTKGNRYFKFGNGIYGGDNNYCMLCNALSELCGLTPAYWIIPSKTWIDTSNTVAATYQGVPEKLCIAMEKAGFTPYRTFLSEIHILDCPPSSYKEGREDKHLIQKNIILIRSNGFIWNDKVKSAIAASSIKGIDDEEAMFFIRNTELLDKEEGGQ